ncbi:MAG: hypothetical protein AMJ54_10725 [Deltaproteobacteria bacterium SG8_13]|nr:MAG: hypothetical protein AMJ54_10725 [Deltaproteobacteria bacterium SG8_13]
MRASTPLHIILALIGAVIAAVVSGCVSWQPDWHRSADAVADTDPSPLLETAERLSLTAGSRPELLATIAAYESVLAVDSSHFTALTSLGHLYILLGAAYTENRTEKVRHYQTARRYNEWAMYTNSEFRARMGEGRKPWEASDALSLREVPAMFYWVTAVMYHFKEGMLLPEKIVNTKWIRWCGVFLKRIEAIDPNWGGGGVQFSLAIYYGVQPKAMGGDRQLSDEYLARAVETGPHWLINRWGRAKYFHVRDRNRSGFEEDLQWVIAQDIHQAGGAYPWKIYFQQDAREMLADAGRYFP